MAKKKKKTKRPGKNYKKNGFFSKAKGKGKNPGFGKKKHHKKNPILPVTTTEFLQVTAGALGGGYGARVIPENIGFLKKYNVGAKGYGLNLLTGFALSKVAKYLSGAKAEEGALVGTLLMTGGRMLSDYLGLTVVQFGNVSLGHDPAFNFSRRFSGMGKYVAGGLPPLPVPTPYANSGPVPPLPVGSAPIGAPALPAGPPATAKQAMTNPTTIAAASSMGFYGKTGRFGTNRFI